MKTLSILFLLALIASMAGCSVSEEDKDFYYSGWVNPNAPAKWKSGMESAHPLESTPGPDIDY